MREAWGKSTSPHWGRSRKRTVSFPEIFGFFSRKPAGFYAFYCGELLVTCRP